MDAALLGAAAMFRPGVYCRPGEPYAQCAISERVNFGGGSVLFWGGVSLAARTALIIIERGTVTAESHITDIFEEQAKPYSGFLGPKSTLMHNNARPHTAMCVRD